MVTILELKDLRDNMALSDCIVYIQDYQKKPKKDPNQFYLTGTFVKQDSSVSFKVWDDTLIKYMSEVSLAGRLVKIAGQTKTFSNQVEVHVSSVDVNVGSDISPVHFLKSVNVDSVFSEFTNFVNTELSENAIKILMGVFKQENLMTRFKEEFAGAKMHDAQVGGLMNHTLKMLKIAKVVYENDNRFIKLPGYKDMLLLGIVFHDIGKLDEMRYGVYQPNTFVTHRITAVEMLSKYKEIISKMYDEKFYYQLIAIITGHHGEYGDKPTTILAQIVHLIDMLESQTTQILDKIELGQIVEDSRGKSLYFDSKYLIF